MAKYLHLAVYLVCFYDAIILLLIPSSATFLLAEDGHAGLMVSILTALAIGLWSLYTHGFQRLPNMWIGWLIFFMAFSSFHGPNVVFDSTFLPKDPGIFNYKPMFVAIIYLLMFLGIINCPLTTDNKHKIYQSIAWVGMLYAGYILSQHLGMDQIYKSVTTTPDQLSRNPQDGGFISQPVYAGAILSLCLPFVLRYTPPGIFLVIAAILATTNRSALVAMAIGSVYMLTASKRYVSIAIVSYIGLIALVMAIYILHPSFHLPICGSGRLAIWKQIIKDIIHPTFPGVDKAYSLTGLGFGSFSIFFPFYHHTPWTQAHNEYLEILYSLSFVGLFLFIKCICDVFVVAKDKCVLASLIMIAVFACTNPVWHIPQLQFLTVFLTGLAYNKEPIYVV